jgi:hypothetical protein
METARFGASPAMLIESTRLDFEQQLAQKDLDVAGREKSIQEREAALSKAKDSLETPVNERMQQERGKIAADEAKKAKLTLSNDIEKKTEEVCPDSGCKLSAPIFSDFIRSATVPVASVGVPPAESFVPE